MRAILGHASCVRRFESELISSLTKSLVCVLIGFFFFQYSRDVPQMVEGRSNCVPV